MTYFYIILVIFLIGAIYLAFFWNKKTKKLDSETLSKLNKIFKQINVNVISQKEKILDYDKLYHKILQELGYEGDFGSILKQNPKQIDDINKIWELHKLRNKLAHDFDLLDENILKKKANDYKNEIQNLLKKVS